MADWLDVDRLEAELIRVKQERDELLSLLAGGASPPG